MSDPFEENDFDAVYKRYFEDLATAGLVVADPSGWARTEAEAEIAIAGQPARPLSHYIVDNRKNIASEKETLLRLLSTWDRQSYAFDEVTITPSISTASLAVLLLLRSRGVETVYFETPAYYVALDQASAIGLRPGRIPSYARDNFDWSPQAISSRRRSGVAIWLTQPRFALGDNQPLHRVQAILRALRERDFLIVDETADQSWPSALSSLVVNERGPTVIKIRGFMKPLGLNALRLALIIHASSYRPALQEAQWTVGAALDYFSLAAAVRVASEPGLFASLLGSARSRVVTLRRRLAAVAAGSALTLSSMENGYLGSLAVEWQNMSGSYPHKRRALLEYCRVCRMPVTVSSAMLFARDTSRQHVRLNYFMPARDLEYCVRELARFGKD
jgi:DNA-binding transcriptional MocR family regulator